VRRQLALGVVFLFACVTAVSGVTQSSSRERGAGEQFVGAWRLAWLEQPGADGKLHRIDCCGMLVYTRDGHMSVQVMEHEPQAGTPAGPEQYSQGGYEASYGRYAVDEVSHTFTFHVEGALVRSLIGKDLPRAYEFSGGQLIVKSTRADEHWRVAWERY
jgi:hypothetical protein